MPDPREVDLRRLRTVVMPAGQSFFSVFETQYSASMFNRGGKGSSRFAPLFNERAKPIGTSYLARTETAALLETVFHEVQPFGIPTISRSFLAGRGIREVVVTDPAGLRLVDIRDVELDRLGMNRAQLVGTTPAHYGCTRQWAHILRGKKKTAQGIIWNSRIAEVASDRSPLHQDLSRSNYAEVMILFEDRVSPSAFTVNTVTTDLSAPLAVEFVEQIADHLGAVIL